MMIWGACHAGFLIMAKPLEVYPLERTLKNESDHLARFALETCVNRVGTSLIIGSSYSTHPDKSLYRAYLTWCNQSDFFPIPLATFQAVIVTVITESLQWKNVYTRKTPTGEHKIFGVEYKHVGAANHG